MEPTVKNINKNGLGAPKRQELSCIPIKHFGVLLPSMLLRVNLKQQSKKPLNGPCLPVQIQKSRKL